MKDDKSNIVFFHPDLGIGGAERLVVDAAVGLQKRGHQVVIFTSHCDHNHCFEEARDGTLDVRVRGNSVIPPAIFNRFSILCAILRQLHLVLQITFFSSELTNCNAGLFFIDQLSACVPLLRTWLPQVPVLFYCHFPDKLLAERESLLKKIYRLPFDWWESWSTGCSNVIVVNSNFTKSIFSEAFPSLNHRQVEVVYPCVSVDKQEQSPSDHRQSPEQLWKDKKVVLSINRFERKKDIGLAIQAFAGLNSKAKASTRLVVAGGYDTRVNENVSYHKELETLADSLKLKTATARSLVSALSIPDEINILFLLSVPSSLRDTLLRASSLLVYTPKFEHFGIVPLEAMLSRVPVLAANAGGPKETVVDSKTGWLRDPGKVTEWTAVMNEVVQMEDKKDGKLLRSMGDAGRARVIEHFSQDSMALRLEQVAAHVQFRDGNDIASQLRIAASLILGITAVTAGVIIVQLR
ncbi:MAG: hypothetical protein Q9162_007553 [Coniocarpon cinnabarinum]